MRRTAFTLIELMIVIFIIGVLIGALTIGLKGAQSSARDSRRLSDVLLIGKVIDQFADTHNGVYPVNVNLDNTSIHANKSTMCVSELLHSSIDNTNMGQNLALSSFSSGKMPVDPRPLKVRSRATWAECGQDASTGAPAISTSFSGMINGYTYHTEYDHSLLAYSNLAEIKQVAYALEVGLENKAGDSGLFQVGPLSLPASAPVAYPTSTGRYQYVLYGPYCSTTCYNK
ncbi:MAG: type II secretion system protein [bacterium]